MRNPIVALLVALTVAGPALCQDPSPSDAAAARTESPEEFASELAELDRSDATTLQRIARRRKLAAARHIHREGRILDVKPSLRDGRDAVCVEVRPVGPGEAPVSLVLASAAGLPLLDWSKGDGLGWLERPVVESDGTVTFEPDVSNPADLLHVAGPGPEPDPAPNDGAKKPGDDAAPAPAKRPVDDGSTLKTWMQILSESCQAGDWRRAWLVYRVGDLSGRTWVFSARVTASDPGGVVVAFDELMPQWDEWPAVAALWGIGRAAAAGQPITRRLDPPKRAADAPAVGAEVEVAVDVGSFGTLAQLKAAAGVFPTQAALRRADPEPRPAAPVPRALAKPVGKPLEYAAWIEKFAAASHAGDARTASDIWADAAKKTWVFPAVIKSAAGGRFEGRFCRDASFKGVTTRKSADPVGGDPWVHTVEQQAGLWGFDPKSNHEFAVTDPDLAAVLRVNMFVDVTIDLDPDGAERAMGGRFPATLTVWRLANAALRTAGPK